ncbi:MAG: L,D-transpeptidase family protein [Gemmatimonadota bacterium]
MRWSVALLGAALLLTPAACDREPRGEPSPRITEVLSGAGSAPVTLQLPGGDTLVLSPDVVAFYKARQYRQAWTDYDEILDRGWVLLETMESATEDGLDPDLYRYDIAARLVNLVEEDSLSEANEPAAMAIVDMVLTEVFGRYAQHLTGGIMDPSASQVEWRIPKDTVEVRALFDRLVADEDPAAVIESLRPGAPEYRLLMEQLARYRQMAAGGGWPLVPETFDAEPGDRAPEVAALRQRLAAEGDAEEARLAAAGQADAQHFDEDLKAALEHFQARHSIEPDGVVGPATLAQLNVTAEERVQQIILNLDQWRWLPQELGERYILVNVAGFEMELVENDSVLLAMNVVVGQEGWETAIFRDTMESIVFNPYWNVPAGIEREEILPAIRRDPGYLARENLEVVRGESVVSPASVDWSAVGEGSPYRFRQRPGPDNALGQVKFLFPNEYDIYLHDTPAKSRFSASQRAFSHGCIRLEKPFDLARVLLDRVTDQSADDLDDLLAGGQEKWVRVTQPLPVYVLYFTAWAGRDGTMRFHPDVYERDRRLEEQAQKRLGTTSAETAP